MSESSRVRRAAENLRLMKWRSFLWGCAVALTVTALVFMFLVRGSDPPSKRPPKITVERSEATPHPDEIAESIILTGDGGDATRDSTEILAREATFSPARTTVVFMGDNVYPRGIPAPEEKDYPSASAKLNRQIDVVLKTHSKGLFIPGNHDWNFSRQGGWDSVKRQEALVTAALGTEAFFPKGGCPGPALAYQSSRFRIIALDSEWWLHRAPKPTSRESGCPEYTEEMVLDSLERLLASRPSGLHDVVITHHPLESYGRHSKGDDCPQSMHCPAYSKMRGAVQAALSKAPPLLCAAGHDHSLQFLANRPGCDYYVVSGALTNVTGSIADEGTVANYPGFGLFRLDALKDGRITLTVFSKARDGKGDIREAFALR